MPIRFAKLQDIPALVDGGQRIHALTRFKNQTYNREKVARILTEIIQRGQGKYAFLVAARSDESVAGALIGVLEQHIFSDDTVATVVVFGVLPEARMGGYAVKLLKGFEEWARAKDSAEVIFGFNSQSVASSSANMMERIGYEWTGSNLFKVLL